MRRLSLILTVFVLALSACAGSHQTELETNGTGQVDSNGVPYITNGNKQMEEALKNDPPPTPVKASQVRAGVKPGTPHAAQTPTALRMRVKEFQISRFKKNAFKPSRFGDHRFKITVFFHHENDVEFNGALNGKDGKWTIDATSSHFQLKGTFTDSQPLKVDGDLHLIDTKTAEIAHIIYSAYKAKLTIHSDRYKKVIAGSVFDQQLKSLRDHTFAWVHNWMVVHGPAFYLVDIVKQVDDGTVPTFAPPLLAFKGESLQTGEQDQPAQSLTPKISSQIAMIGNSPKKRRRWFEATLEDLQSKESNSIVIDVQGEHQPKASATGQSDDSQQSADDEEEGEDFADLLDQPGETTLAPDPATQQPPLAPPSAEIPAPQPAPPPVETPPAVQAPANPVRPAPVKPLRPAPVVQPLAPSTSYLKIDMSLPRTSRMTHDFARNRHIPGVVAWMKKYGNPKDWHHRDLARFYYYAHPFRSIIETIARAYDVSSSFAYLTVIESPYFTGGKYQVTSEKKSSAVGPFQLLEGTAKGLGMIYSGAGDERRYFAPSACGAARYIGQLVKMFEDSDTTVSILGYYQGQGGAARAIVCTYGDRSSCNGKNYSRYMHLAKNIGFSYKDIDSVAAIPKDQRDYVNKKLAIYFISEDIAKYSFQSGGVNSLQGINNIFPNRQISDGVCRQAMQSMTGI